MYNGAMRFIKKQWYDCEMELMSREIPFNKSAQYFSIDGWPGMQKPIPSKACYVTSLLKVTDSIRSFPQKARKIHDVESIPVLNIRSLSQECIHR
jgi:hypothetical protein